MKVIKPSHEILTKINREEILKSIELAGRTCYKSEEKMTKDSASAFVSMVMKRGHHSVIEHQSISVKFICNRGFTHELVRHRLAAYSQESTRYCNYGKNKYGNEITVIEPYWWNDVSEEIKAAWMAHISSAEDTYLNLLQEMKSEGARGVLPIDLKTEIAITANLREFLHIFTLRTSKHAHPDMRRLMIPLLKEFAEILPEIYGELYEKTL